MWIYDESTVCVHPTRLCAVVVDSNKLFFCNSSFSTIYQTKVDAPSCITFTNWHRESLTLAATNIFDVRIYSSIESTDSQKLLFQLKQVISIPGNSISLWVSKHLVLCPLSLYTHTPPSDSPSSIATYKLKNTFFFYDCTISKDSSPHFISSSIGKIRLSTFIHCALTPQSVFDCSLYDDPPSVYIRDAIASPSYRFLASLHDSNESSHYFQNDKLNRNHPLYHVLVWYKDWHSSEVLASKEHDIASSVYAEQPLLSVKNSTRSDRPQDLHCLRLTHHSPVEAMSFRETSTYYDYVFTPIVLCTLTIDSNLFIWVETAISEPISFIPACRIQIDFSNPLQHLIDNPYVTNHRRQRSNYSKTSHYSEIHTESPSTTQSACSKHAPMADISSAFTYGINNGVSLAWILPSQESQQDFPSKEDLSLPRLSSLVIKPSKAAGDLYPRANSVASSSDAHGDGEDLEPQLNTPANKEKSTSITHTISILAPTWMITEKYFNEMQFCSEARSSDLRHSYAIHNDSKATYRVSKYDAAVGEEHMDISKPGSESSFSSIEMESDYFDFQRKHYSLKDYEIQIPAKSDLPLFTNVHASSLTKRNVAVPYWRQDVMDLLFISGFYPKTHSSNNGVALFAIKNLCSQPRCQPFVRRIFSPTEIPIPYKVARLVSAEYSSCSSIGCEASEGGIADVSRLRNLPIPEGDSAPFLPSCRLSLLSTEGDLLTLSLSSNGFNLIKVLPDDNLNTISQSVLSNICAGESSVRVAKGSLNMRILKSVAKYSKVFLLRKLHTNRLGSPRAQVEQFDSIVSYVLRELALGDEHGHIIENYIATHFVQLPSKILRHIKKNWKKKLEADTHGDDCFTSSSTDEEQFNTKNNSTIGSSSIIKRINSPQFNYALDHLDSPTNSNMKRKEKRKIYYEPINTVREAANEGIRRLSRKVIPHPSLPLLCVIDANGRATIHYSPMHPHNWQDRDDVTSTEKFVKLPEEFAEVSNPYGSGAFGKICSVRSTLPSMFPLQMEKSQWADGILLSTTNSPVLLSISTVTRQFAAIQINPCNRGRAFPLCKGLAYQSLSDYLPLTLADSGNIESVFSLKLLQSVFGVSLKEVLQNKIVLNFTNCKLSTGVILVILHIRSRIRTNDVLDDSIVVMVVLESSEVLSTKLKAFTQSGDVSPDDVCLLAVSINTFPLLNALTPSFNNSFMDLCQLPGGAYVPSSFANIQFLENSITSMEALFSRSINPEEFRDANLALPKNLCRLFVSKADQIPEIPKGDVGVSMSDSINSSLFFNSGLDEMMESIKMSVNNAASAEANVEKSANNNEARTVEKLGQSCIEFLRTKKSSRQENIGTLFVCSPPIDPQHFEEHSASQTSAFAGVYTIKLPETPFEKTVLFPIGYLRLKKEMLNKISLSTLSETEGKQWMRPDDILDIKFSTCSFVTVLTKSPSIHVYSLSLTGYEIKGAAVEKLTRMFFEESDVNKNTKEQEDSELFLPLYFQKSLNHLTSELQTTKKKIYEQSVTAPDRYAQIYADNIATLYPETKGFGESKLSLISSTFDRREGIQGELQVNTVGISAVVLVKLRTTCCYVGEGPMSSFISEVEKDANTSDYDKTLKITTKPLKPRITVSTSFVWGSSGGPLHWSEVKSPLTPPSIMVNDVALSPSFGFIYVWTLTKKLCERLSWNANFLKFASADSFTHLNLNGPTLILFPKDISFRVRKGASLPLYHPSLLMRYVTSNQLDLVEKVLYKFLQFLRILFPIKLESSANRFASMLPCTPLPSPHLSISPNLLFPLMFSNMSSLQSSNLAVRKALIDLTDHQTRQETDPAEETTYQCHFQWRHDGEDTNRARTDKINLLFNNEDNPFALDGFDFFKFDEKKSDGDSSKPATKEPEVVTFAVDTTTGESLTTADMDELIDMVIGISWIRLGRGEDIMEKQSTCSDFSNSLASEYDGNEPCGVVSSSTGNPALSAPGGSKFSATSRSLRYSYYKKVFSEGLHLSSMDRTRLAAIVQILRNRSCDGGEDVLNSDATVFLRSNVKPTHNEAQSEDIKKKKSAVLLQMKCNFDASDLYGCRFLFSLECLMASKNYTTEIRKTRRTAKYAIDNFGRSISLISGRKHGDRDFLSRENKSINLEASLSPSIAHTPGLRYVEDDNCDALSGSSNVSSIESRSESESESERYSNFGGSSNPENVASNINSALEAHPRSLDPEIASTTNSKAQFRRNNLLYVNTSSHTSGWTLPSPTYNDDKAHNVFSRTRVKPLDKAQEKTRKKILLTTQDIFMSLLAESEELLFSKVKTMISMDNGFSWKRLRYTGAGFWVKSVEVLKIIAELIPQAYFNRYTRNASLDPIALWFVLLGKNFALSSMYKYQKNSKLVDFLMRNFDEEKNTEAAEKNAFELLRQKRFMLAAAFFVLGNCYQDAVSVCIKHLKDYQLALIMIRMLDIREDTLRPEQELVKENMNSLNFKYKRTAELYCSTIRQYFFDLASETQDIWLSCSLHYLLGDYVSVLAMASPSRLSQDLPNLDTKFSYSIFFPRTETGDILPLYIRTSHVSNDIQNVRTHLLSSLPILRILRNPDHELHSTMKSLSKRILLLNMLIRNKELGEESNTKGDSFLGAKFSKMILNEIKELSIERTDFLHVIYAVIEETSSFVSESVRRRHTTLAIASLCQGSNSIWTCGGMKAVILAANVSFALKSFFDLPALDKYLYDLYKNNQLDPMNSAMIKTQWIDFLMPIEGISSRSWIRRVFLEAETEFNRANDLLSVSLYSSFAPSVSIIRKYSNVNVDEETANIIVRGILAVGGSDQTGEERLLRRRSFEFAFTLSPAATAELNGQGDDNNITKSSILDTQSKAYEVELLDWETKSNHTIASLKRLLALRLANLHGDVDYRDVLFFPRLFALSNVGSNDFFSLEERMKHPLFGVSPLLMKAVSNLIAGVSRCEAEWKERKKEQKVTIQLSSHGLSPQATSKPPTSSGKMWKNYSNATHKAAEPYNSRGKRELLLDKETHLSPNEISYYQDLHNLFDACVNFHSANSRGGRMLSVSSVKKLAWESFVVSEREIENIIPGITHDCLLDALQKVQGITSNLIQLIMRCLRTANSDTSPPIPTIGQQILACQHAVTVLSCFSNFDPMYFEYLENPISRSHSFNISMDNDKKVIHMTPEEIFSGLDRSLVDENRYYIMHSRSALCTLGAVVSLATTLAIFDVFTELTDDGSDKILMQFLATALDAMGDKSVGTSAFPPKNYSSLRVVASWMEAKTSFDNFFLHFHKNKKEVEKSELEKFREEKLKWEKRLICTLNQLLEVVIQPLTATLPFSQTPVIPVSFSMTALNEASYDRIRGPQMGTAFMNARNERAQKINVRSIYQPVVAIQACANAFLSPSLSPLLQNASKIVNKEVIEPLHTFFSESNPLKKKRQSLLERKAFLLENLITSDDAAFDWDFTKVREFVTSKLKETRANIPYMDDIIDSIKKEAQADRDGNLSDAERLRYEQIERHVHKVVFDEVLDIDSSHIHESLVGADIPHKARIAPPRVLQNLGSSKDRSLLSIIRLLSSYCVQKTLNSVTAKQIHPSDSLVQQKLSEQWNQIRSLLLTGCELFFIEKILFSLLSLSNSFFDSVGTFNPPSSKSKLIFGIGDGTDSKIISLFKVDPKDNVKIVNLIDHVQSLVFDCKGKKLSRSLKETSDVLALPLSLSSLSGTSTPTHISMNHPCIVPLTNSNQNPNAMNQSNPFLRMAMSSNVTKKRFKTYCATKNTSIVPTIQDPFFSNCNFWLSEVFSNDDKDINLMYRYENWVNFARKDAGATLSSMMKKIKADMNFNKKKSASIDSLQVLSNLINDGELAMQYIFVQLFGNTLANIWKQVNGTFRLRTIVSKSSIYSPTSSFSYPSPSRVVLQLKQQMICSVVDISQSVSTGYLACGASTIGTRVINLRHHALFASVANASFPCGPICNASDLSNQYSALRRYDLYCEPYDESYKSMACSSVLKPIRNQSTTLMMDSELLLCGTQVGATWKGLSMLGLAGIPFSSNQWNSEGEISRSSVKNHSSGADSSRSNSEASHDPIQIMKKKVRNKIIKITRSLLPPPVDSHLRAPFCMAANPILPIFAVALGNPIPTPLVSSLSTLANSPVSVSAAAGISLLLDPSPLFTTSLQILQATSIVLFSFFDGAPLASLSSDIVTVANQTEQGNESAFASQRTHHHLNISKGDSARIVTPEAPPVLRIVGPSRNLGEATHLSWSANGSRLLCSYTSGYVSIWCIENKCERLQQSRRILLPNGSLNLQTVNSSPLASFLAHPNGVNSAVFISPGGTLFATAGQGNPNTKKRCSESASICVWDLLKTTGDVQATLVGYDCELVEGATSISVWLPGQLLVCGGKKGEVKIMEIKNLNPIITFTAIPNQASVVFAEITNDHLGGARLVVASIDGQVTVWYMETLLSQGPTNTVNSKHPSYFHIPFSEGGFLKNEGAETITSSQYMEVGGILPGLSSSSPPLMLYIPTVLEQKVSGSSDSLFPSWSTVANSLSKWSLFSSGKHSNRVISSVQLLSPRTLMTVSLSGSVVITRI